ncbi:hypothetical protein [Aquimarina algiphila]|uniref:Uncharacterized protein n=1 Tax=Aquimarina algiphila TaxID=2047982 RepID=A0A554VDG9_9FLAO|nr:hypothetical protein [Aquimarina algiphila]TSE04896.1 hypothetical protein FOF46_24740 [Aquimarina algiphila]
MKTLPKSELKLLLQERIEKFNQCRTSNGKVTRVDLELSNTTYDDIISEKETSDLNIESIDKTVTSEDTTKATKTYSEKIKVGYFGKRRSRF